MKKRVLLQTAIVAGSFMLVPAVVNARRGADDPAGHVRQEDRRQDSTPAVQGTSTTPTVINNNIPTQGSTDDNSSSIPSSSSNNSTSTPTPTVASAVTLSQARAIADATLPNKTFEKVEQETEEGVLVWSIRYTDGSRVDVAVNSGDVMRVRDRANDDDRSDSSDDDNDDDSGRGRGRGRGSDD